MSGTLCLKKVDKSALFTFKRAQQPGDLTTDDDQGIVLNITKPSSETL